MAEKTLGSRAGDFLIHMESPQRCLHYGQLTMPLSGTGPFTAANVVGLPLRASNVVALSGCEAAIVAFVIAGEPLSEQAAGSATTGPLYTILNVFDGVVLNEDALPSTDASDTPGTFTKATITANAADSANSHKPKWVDEPENTSTQLD